MKTRLTLLVISFFIFQLAKAQTVHTVDNRPESGAQFTSVQAAIDAASAGDIIYIHPSPTSYGSIDITKTIKLVGPGHNPANSGGLTANLTAVDLYADAANSVITGLVVTNISAYSFGSNTHNIQIINNRITSSIQGYFTNGHSDNWIVEGNYFSTSYANYAIYADNLNNLQVRNNIIEGRINESNHTNVFTNNLFLQDDPSGDAQIFISSNGITSPIVANNMFVFTDPDITGLTSTGTAITYTNCLTWKSAGDVLLATLPGSGNIDNTDPQFSSIPTSVDDYYNNDYSLNVGSPAIGMATDGGDIGVFGRNFPYDVNGRPHSMPFPESMTILNTVVQPGQDLNVEFQATQKN